MSDYVLALCTFSCSQSKKGYLQILFFNWEFLSKAIELVSWDTKQRSSSMQYRRTLRLWRSCAISREIPSQASQTFQESSDNFAELHHSLCSCQTWALHSIMQHKQKTGHNWSVHWPVKLNVRRCARGKWLRLHLGFGDGFQSPLHSFSGLWIYCTCASAWASFLLFSADNNFKIFSWGMVMRPNLMINKQ